ncbi:MAG TPA: NADH-ubiquinone oxidoreductase-F iron-sulfur binding region domain-containing protein [Rickettsiales bacterium]|nr:NADH-ubiquinone oxidoreductase-F iron-sulfur binding region domain-containing protein [Rickettsiales bacterium]
MDKNLVVEKLKVAKIFGKGGAAFPTDEKWKGVGEAEGNLKYIIVNSSEGEMGLFKDLYVWRNHMDKVFKGIDYGIKFLNCDVEVFIHINQDYYNELQGQIFKYINDYKWSGVKFHISIENPCYIGGEASALMNIIETGVAQPKLRAKRTVVAGLFEKPTMMNNVETFYEIAETLDGTYDNTRFSGIFGDGIEKKFVARHDVNATIAQILKDNKVNPNFDYFVQIGGSASGPVYNKSQLNDIIMTGAGSIEIYDKSKRNFLTFLKRIGNFYEKESCGKCMGKKFATSVNEIIQKYNSVDEIKVDELLPLINDMNKKTFCKLCKSLKTPFITYCNNVLGMKLE